MGIIFYVLSPENITCALFRYKPIPSSQIRDLRNVDVNKWLRKSKTSVFHPEWCLSENFQNACVNFQKVLSHFEAQILENYGARAMLICIEENGANWRTWELYLLKKWNARRAAIKMPPCSLGSFMHCWMQERSYYGIPLMFSDNFPVCSLGTWHFVVSAACRLLMFCIPLNTCRNVRRKIDVSPCSLAIPTGTDLNLRRDAPHE